jgi:hypothetical protein
MKRSTTQVLLRYLPDAVFSHEEGFIAKVDHVDGPRVGDLNQRVLLEELASELERWSPEQVGIPNPRLNSSEYVFIQPREVSWDVYPLTFECLRQNCKRVARFFTQASLLESTAAAGHLRCASCNSRMRQLRYLTAHNCGAMEPMHTPSCPVCKDATDMYLEDLGSFATSSWRCRKCNYAIGTRFTPCNCGRYVRGGTRPYRRGFTERDQRLWYPQTLTIINISNLTFDQFQQSPQRGVAALASWIGDQLDLATSLSEMGHASGGTRLSADAWADQERGLRASGVDESVIDEVRRLKGPIDRGVSAVAAGVDPRVIEAFSHRPMVERAGLFDKKIVDDRWSFEELRATTAGPERTAANYTGANLAALGIRDVSVTQKFPLLLASYGYSRCQREPGTSDLRSFAKASQHGGKTPVFAVPAHTEALIVTFDARSMLGFLAHIGTYSGSVASDSRAASLALAELLAISPDAGGDDAAGQTRRLVHSASHALLRALDDGRSGFGESSLAEWIVPDALTTAVYVASYNDFTLGALDTVLRRRLAQWMLATSDSVDHCDNDPLCSQTSAHRPHAACDRCLYMSYGCRTWNADLDRRLLRRFWLWTKVNPVPL